MNQQRIENTMHKWGLRTLHVFIAICVFAMIVCGYAWCRDIFMRLKSDRLDDDVRGLYKSTSLDSLFFPAACAEDIPETMQPENMPSETDAPDVSEDFKRLLSENEHTVGWLTLGESIDLPVVQKDNSYYLTHNFYGRSDSNGTLFLNVENNFWPRDDVLLIHGHNMKSGAMFGRIMKYEDFEYLQKHSIVTFRTIFDEQDVYYVPIAAFSASMVKGNSAYFDIMQINFGAVENVNIEPSVLANMQAQKKADYQTYLNEVISRSIWHSPVSVDVQDELLMLVTCSYYHEDGRFLLICRKLRTGETPEEIKTLFTEQQTSCAN